MRRRASRAKSVRVARAWPSTIRRESLNVQTRVDQNNFSGRAGLGWLTVDDPTLDLGRGHLQRGGYLRVGQVLPDILESEIGEREQADLALELGGVQPCIFS